MIEVTFALTVVNTLILMQWHRPILRSGYRLGCWLGFYIGVACAYSVWWATAPFPRLRWKLADRIMNEQGREAGKDVHVG